MKKNKRRTVLVDKTTQVAIVKQSLLHWLYHSLVTIVFLAILQFVLGGMFKPWDEIWQSIWPIAASVYLSLFVLLPVFVLSSFKLSNRFAGPIGRVRRALRDIAAGKPYVPLQVRDGDFWPEIAQEFNAAVEVLLRKKAVDQDHLQMSAR
jgi:hypothetical protein